MKNHLITISIMLFFAILLYVVNAYLTVAWVYISLVGIFVLGVVYFLIYQLVDIFRNN